MRYCEILHETIDLTSGGGSKQVTIGATTITYGVSRDTAEVILIDTPRKKRGEGSARAAMMAFLQATDDAGLTVFLTASPMDDRSGLSQTALEKFYKSLGFRANRGRKKDFRAMAGMVRDPPEALRESAPPFPIPQVWYHSTELDPVEVAGDFANNNSDGTGVIDVTAEYWFSDDWDASRYYGENSVVAHLRINNPLLVTSEEFAEKRGGPSSYWAKKAREKGHDAVIIHDICDGDMYSTVCAVFEANQISAKPYSRYNEETDKFDLL